MDKTVEITKEELAELLREFPTWGHAAVYYKRKLAQAERENQRWLVWSGGQYPDESPGDVIAAMSDGTITLDDGITTWNPLRALRWMALKSALAARLAQADKVISDLLCSLAELYEGEFEFADWKNFGKTVEWQRSNKGYRPSDQPLWDEVIAALEFLGITWDEFVEQQQQQQQQKP